MDATLLILAGGGSTRFGHLNTILPKSALPAFDESTLVRNLRQALEAGFRDIVVSTRPSFQRLLEELVGGAREGVRVVANRHHDEGPLPALFHLLARAETPRVALALSDIFFLGNPYEGLRARAHTPDTHLGVAEPFDPRELAQGGIVLCDSESVEAVLEAPSEGLTRGARWSGLAAFDTGLRARLEAHLDAAGGQSPIGDFFESCRAAGQRLRPLPVPDFINVNTRHDLFLASMYRAVEVHGEENEAGRALASAARLLRRRRPS